MDADTIPADCLARILGRYCAGYAPATREVCCLWRDLASASGALKLKELAVAGHEDLLRWVVDRNGWSSLDTDTANGMLRGAALGGHEHLCILAKTWGAKDFDRMLYYAARGGHEHLCVLAKEWGATSVSAINGMLYLAAQGGHESLCILAKEWGADWFDQMLQGAVEGGHEHLCILAKEWIREVAGE